MTAHHHADHADIIAKGIAGGAINMLGFITSFQEQLEWGVRMASLVIGLLVGVFTLIAILRKMRSEKRHRKGNQS